MSDALSLLRNFVKIKRDFQEEEDKIIFGDVYYPKNVKTTYIIYGTGKDGRPKDYYTLECLAFLIKNRDLQHPMYVKNAGTRNISVVSRPDRRDLLSYLDGEVETSPSIDKNVPLEIAMQRALPYVKSSSSSISGNLASSSSGSKRPVTSGTSSTLAATSSNELDSTGPDADAPSAKVAKLAGAFSESSDASSAPSTSTSTGLISDLAQQQATLKEQFIGRITKKFDETAAQSQRAITDNIMQLSDTLTKEKIAALKAKKKAMQRMQVSSGVDVDDDPLLAASSSQASTTSNRNDRSSRLITDYSNLTGSSTAGVYMSGGPGDDSDTIMREIVKRETVSKNRLTVLQSTGKQFEKDINAFLQLIKAKEDAGGVDPTQQVQLSQTQQIQLSQTQTQQQQQQQQQQQAILLAQQQKSRQMGYNRFDQERYAAKDETGGFSIDTKLTYQPNGGALSLTPNPNATPSQNTPDSLGVSQKPVPPPPTQQATMNVVSSQLTQQKTNIISNSSLNSSSIVISKSKYQSPNQIMPKMTNIKPIIIVPNTNTSLITLFNCLDILQDLKYVNSEEKRKSLQNQNALKEYEIILHRKEDGTSQQFKVIDNVQKLHAQDWNRVVAVFAQGKQWQFKDWPFGNPVEIFNKIKGFHLKMSGIPLDPNISKWSVNVIELDQHRRHLDRARLLSFWDELYKFMAKNKPYLCS